MPTISIINGDELFLNTMRCEELDNIVFQRASKENENNTTYLGYILVNKVETDFNYLVALLLDQEKYKESIIWFFSERKLTEQEQNILLHLEVNFILSNQSDVTFLKRSIVNLISWLHRFKLAKKLETGKVIEKHDERVVLDIANRSLVISDEEIQLTNKEYLLMSKLFNSLGRTVSYKELNKAIGGQDDSNMKLRVSNPIFRIRKKINKNPNVVIDNISSRGYRLRINQSMEDSTNS